MHLRTLTGLAASIALTYAATGDVVVKATFDQRDGELVVSDTASGGTIWEWFVLPPQWYMPANIDHTISDNGRIAHAVHSSQWFGADPTVATTGFTMISTYTGTKPSGPGFAACYDFAQLKVAVSGLASGETIRYRFAGSLDENGGGAGSVFFSGPSISISISSDSAWDDIVELRNGTYTFMGIMDFNANESAATTKSVSIVATLEPHVPAPQCGAAGAGSCFWAHAAGGCDDVECCDTVCIIDPACCATAWDAECATTAAAQCASATGSGVIINPANGHRYQLVTASKWVDAIDFSGDAELGAQDGCALTINNAAENEWVRTHLASNVPGFAGATELFISEYYEGTGVNNHAIELYNATTAAVDLASGEYKLLVYTDGATTPTAFALQGVIQPDAAWLVAPANANAQILAQTDETIASGFLFDGNDAVALAKGARDTLIDVVGQIGFNPGAEWGSGTASTKDNGIHRKPLIAAGDANGSDAFDPLVEWIGSAAGNFSGLGDHVATCDGPFNVWTGFNDQSIEGLFQWKCGSSTYLNWTPGEPASPDFVELLGATGQWRTQGGSVRNFGVTEFKAAFCGVNGNCFAAHGTPGCADESCCNTVCFVDPHCCSAPWDAVCAEEANAYCSPGILAGPIVDSGNGHQYYLLDRAAWSEAQETAQSLGGTLVTINGGTEHAWVLEHVAQFDGDVTRECFIGLTDQAADGRFRWSDHTTVGYAQWAASQPALSAEDNFTVQNADGTWETTSNYAAVFAIVELPCAGDLDGTGVVDGADLAIFLGAWGASQPTADLTHDGLVDGADLAVLLGAWGDCGG